MRKYKILIPVLVLSAMLLIQAQAPKVAVNLLYDLGYLNIELPPDMSKVSRWKEYGDSACLDMMYYRIQNTSSAITLDATIGAPDSGEYIRQITIRHKLHQQCFNQRSFLNARSVLKQWKKQFRVRPTLQDSMQVGKHKFVMMGYEASIGATKLHVLKSAAFVKSQWLEFECVSSKENDTRFVPEMKAAFRTIRFD